MDYQLSLKVVSSNLGEMIFDLSFACEAVHDEAVSNLLFIKDFHQEYFNLFEESTYKKQRNVFHQSQMSFSQYSLIKILAASFVNKIHVPSKLISVLKASGYKHCS